MNKGLWITLGGTLACLAALAAWFFTAPAEGSQYILLVAFLGSFGLLGSIHKAGLATVAGAIITIASGAAWYFHQGLPNDNFVLVLCILAGLGTFSTLSESVDKGTKNK